MIAELVGDLGGNGTQRHSSAWYPWLVVLKTRPSRMSDTMQIRVGLTLAAGTRTYAWSDSRKEFN